MRGTSLDLNLMSQFRIRQPGSERALKGLEAYKVKLKLKCGFGTVFVIVVMSSQCAIAGTLMVKQDTF
ncbi:hypothetical protein BT69DRAFT_506313 [Atractiella rhizophila]|nr:hypothetical protein BT69DRAFT_506313 [Atractiella rhizophila]